MRKIKEYTLIGVSEKGFYSDFYTQLLKDSETGEMQYYCLCHTDKHTFRGYLSDDEGMPLTEKTDDEDLIFKSNAEREDFMISGVYYLEVEE